MGELFTALQHGLGTVLAFFYDLIPSFGISIILLTIGVNVVLFPLTRRQTRSTRAFQAIQPEIKRLQKEYKDDKEKMQEELMKAQKEAGATPGGCLLPMLVQMPIWFALFRVFRNVAQIAQGVDGVTPVIPLDSGLLTAIQSGKTHFMGLGLGTTMSDGVLGGLPGAIPYVFFLILMIGAQYAQQWYLSKGQPGNKGKNGGTQQMVTKIMPLFIGFISWNFPAGLVVYWTTSNLVRLGQQALILKLEPIVTHDDEDEDASPQDTDEEDPGPKGVAPQSRSKKKKGRRRG